jgi:hypothetical protein
MKYAIGKVASDGHLDVVGVDGKTLVWSTEDDAQAFIDSGEVEFENLQTIPLPTDWPNTVEVV